jgi:inward rectifier potassium channel
MSGIDENARPAPEQRLEDVNADLGFGAIVARESRKRLLNRDGSFNVRREGLPLLQSLSLYHYFLTITWPKLFAYLVAGYLSANALFALAYLACGEDALSGLSGQSPAQRFATAFFFSVDTVVTIGYGSVTPHNLAANLLVTFEAFIGLISLAFVAGIVFARFSRPTAQIVFSRNAIVAPYRGITALMFRIVNQKSNEIVEMQAKVLLARRKRGGVLATDREFIQLKLERDGVVFFPLAWTIVHPIDATSPLYGLDAEALRAQDGELLILLNGFDETFSQTVHTRSSYKADEVVWGAKFRTMFNPPREDGTISVDIRKLHEIEPAQLDGR